MSKLKSRKAKIRALNPKREKDANFLAKIVTRSGDWDICKTALETMDKESRQKHAFDMAKLSRKEKLAMGAFGILVASGICNEGDYGHLLKFARSEYVREAALKRTAEKTNPDTLISAVEKDPSPLVRAAAVKILDSNNAYHFCIISEAAEDSSALVSNTAKYILDEASEDILLELDKITL